MKKILKKEFFVKTRTGSFRVVVWWDEKDRTYLVKVPSLPEVVTFGTSIIDAKRMAKDAVELYCDCEVGEGNLIIDDLKNIIGKLPASRVLKVSPVTR